ncbi:MAG: hypothetical protein R3A47_09190 [Polyangiales bacterium]
MLFNSIDYLLFLAASVVGYWSLRRFGLARLTFLFIVSCFFYMAWHPTYIVLILASTLIDFVAGLRIDGAKSQRVRKFWLVVSLTANLGLLGVFKYFNFFAQAIADIWFVVFGVTLQAPHLNVLLPVGISFYTFQTMSYTIDVYRGSIKPTRSLLEFACFVTYFPQLVAGPIVRASEFLPQLQKKISLNRNQVSEGLFSSERVS